MNEKLTIIYSNFDSYKELSDLEQKLVLETKEYLKRSYSPYSKFQVAAAVVLSDGSTYFGTNQENSAFPSCMCAEQVALGSINSHFPEKHIARIIVCTSSKETKVAAPCGNCRQVISEYEMRQKQNIQIILVGNPQVVKLDSARLLLPFGFDSSHF